MKVWIVYSGVRMSGVPRQILTAYSDKQVAIAKTESDGFEWSELRGAYLKGNEGVIYRQIEGLDVIE